METYIFLCLAEVLSRPINCYAYGIHKSIKPTAKPLDAKLALTGCEKVGMIKKKMKSREKLVHLGLNVKTGLGVFFKAEDLPHNGAMTKVDDKLVIQALENQIRWVYGKCAIGREMDRTLELVESGDPNVVFDVSGKQIACAQAAWLGRQLAESDFAANRLISLTLRSNSVRSDGFAALCETYLCKDVSSNLEMLDLGGNSIDVEGMQALSKWVDPETCHITTILLDHNAIGGKGGIALAEWWGKATAVKSLNINHNGVTEPAAIVLVKTMSTHPGMGILKMAEPEGISESTINYMKMLQEKIATSGSDAFTDEMC